MSKKFTVFKIAYELHDGDSGEVLVAKTISEALFEQDLKEAKEFAQGLIGTKTGFDYLGKGYSVECLPEYYEQIVWFLTEKKGYVCCEQDESITYFVNDDVDKKINFRKRTESVHWDDV